ncbi:MAG: peptide-methionine (R)-S-oxide reductase [Ignavibacteriae bacterium]|nr:MAG: peptide-methionine (R)-S-oxide reductase [Ignavibacteriota bacterium]
MNHLHRFALIGMMLTAAACQAQTTTNTKDTTMFKVNKTEEEWRKQLSPFEYQVLREKGTERAFTGEYWDHHEDGTYTCKGCGAPLFSSNEKFDSGCGWPSYYDAIDSGAIVTKPDNTLGMMRTEIMCAKCGGHLGHVFDDGPKPTGLRYCVNSASVQFKSSDDQPKK